MKTYDEMLEMLDRQEREELAEVRRTYAELRAALWADIAAANPDNPLPAIIADRQRMQLMTPEEKAARRREKTRDRVRRHRDQKRAARNEGVNA